MQSCFCKNPPGKLVIQIIRCICKSSEYDDFLIVSIYRMRKLVLQILHKLPQLGIVFRSNILQHKYQQFQYLHVSFQIPPPAHVIHIPKTDFRLPAYERIIFNILAIEVFSKISHVHCPGPAFFKPVNCSNGRLYKIIYPCQSQAERIYTAFQSFK